MAMLPDRIQASPPVKDAIDFQRFVDHKLVTEDEIKYLRTLQRCAERMMVVIQKREEKQLSRSAYVDQTVGKLIQLYTRLFAGLQDSEWPDFEKAVKALIDRIDWLANTSKISLPKE